MAAETERELMGGGIDWTAVKRRIAASDERLRLVLTGAPELFEAVLDQRTADLARPAEPDRAGRFLPVLIVRGAANRFALPLAGVARVAALARWTPLPAAPPHVLGLTSCEGERTLLLDIDVLVSGARRPDADGFAVVLRGGGGRVALRVAAAEEVTEIPAPRDADAAEVLGRHVRALASDGTAVLDLDSILQRAHWGREA